MRIETAIKRRDSAIAKTRALYSTATICGMSADDMNTRLREIVANMGKVPQWAVEYVSGYEKALRDSIYQNHLIHGAFYNGEFVSTHSKRVDYYQNRGIDPCAFATNGATKRRGHYWMINGTPRPYFVGEDEESANA